MYIFCVIIYVIIYCYHDIYIMKNYNILYNQKDNTKELKNDNIYTIENNNIQALKGVCTASDRPFLSKETSTAYTTHRKRE